MITRWLLHHCEHLVQKRICQKLILTRLPTGHTHEDIDAVFGLIRQFFLSFDTIHTFSQFKDGLKALFKADKDFHLLEAEVYDLVVCIPDYKQFYDPYLDGKLADYARLEHTQHQWKFEAVEISQWFPLGAKTCYRAYSTNCVVVFEKKAKDECLSDIGAATGLEPVTLYCPWHPATYDDPSRPGVEGFYLLKSIPHSPMGILPPFEFAEDSVQMLRKSLQAIHRDYHPINDAAIRNEWNKWFSTICPISNCASEYVEYLKNQRIVWHIPLKNMLLDGDLFIVNPDWLYKHPLQSRPTTMPLFQWPPILAAAMHSVHTDMNLHPQQVRLYSPQDLQLVEDRNLFKETLRGPYYENILRAPAMTNTKLLQILRRRVGYKGEEPAKPGTYFKPIN